MPVFTLFLFLLTNIHSLFCHFVIIILELYRNIVKPCTQMYNTRKLYENSNWSNHILQVLQDTILQELLNYEVAECMIRSS